MASTCQRVLAGQFDGRQSGAQLLEFVTATRKVFRNRIRAPKAGGTEPTTAASSALGFD